MPVKIENPQDEVRNRGREIKTRDIYASMDPKEIADRQEAAKAYAGEDEKHFVDYAAECVKESTEQRKDIREVQAQCWAAYNEWEPASFKNKEQWQSRVMLPKPFQTVQFGAAAVKKAFSPRFLSVEQSDSNPWARFWQRLLDVQLGVSHARFISRFGDASIMGFAVGESLEMIPRWVRGKGFEFAMTEPWKIQRDPYAMSRKSQSGLYWIHQEWLDYFVLQDGEAKGRYFDVKRVKDVAEQSSGSDPFLTKEAIAARKNQMYQSNRYRTMLLTSEVWGTILDKRGNVLLPRGMYTVSAGRVIQKPEIKRFNYLRWPGVQFSPLPNILRFGGRGLLEGVISLWDAINEIMCLHMDALKWLVNPPEEINIEGLVDPTDVASAPGHKYLVKDTVNGQQVVRTVQRPSRTSEVLANMQYFDQNYQRGAFVTDAVQGLPGYRKDMTFREAAMNLDQAMGVFGLMGEALEEGAIECVLAAADVIFDNIGYQDLIDSGFSEQELSALGIEANPEAPRGIVGLHPFEGTCHVSGMQALMRDAETLKALREIIVPALGHPELKPYIDGYKTLKAIEQRVNLVDEGLIASEDEAKKIKDARKEAAGKQGSVEDFFMRLKQVSALADIATKMKELDQNDIAEAGQETQQLEAAYGQGTQRGPGNVAPGGPGQQQRPQ